jgi:diacylglycerol kinase family enzyme
MGLPVSWKINVKFPSVLNFEIRGTILLQSAGSPLQKRMASVKRGQLTVVLNREAGTLVSLGPESVEAGLREIFTAMGCGVEILNVPGAKVEDALRQALHGKAEAVLVGGGNGTVASAATIFAGQDKPLGILPLGTFNLAARDLGMSMEWEQAAAQLVTAPVTEADLLDVEGKLYFCVVVLGFYPALVMGREEYHGNWLVKTIRTVMDAIRRVATFRPLNLRLSQNGSTESHRTRMALIANNDYQDMFGIIPELPEPHRCRYGAGLERTGPHCDRSQLRPPGRLEPRLVARPAFPPTGGPHGRTLRNGGCRRPAGVGGAPSAGSSAGWHGPTFVRTAGGIHGR